MKKKLIIAAAVLLAAAIAAVVFWPREAPCPYNPQPQNSFSTLCQDNLFENVCVVDLRESPETGAIIVALYENNDGRLTPMTFEVWPDTVIHGPRDTLEVGDILSFRCNWVLEIYPGVYDDVSDICVTGTASAELLETLLADHNLWRE